MVVSGAGSAEGALEYACKHACIRMRLPPPLGTYLLALVLPPLTQVALPLTAPIGESGPTAGGVVPFGRVATTPSFSLAMPTSTCTMMAVPAVTTAGDYH